MVRWWITVVVAVMLAACSRVPDRNDRSAAASAKPAEPVAAAEPSRLASGALADDPGPGGRKPPPPVVGSGRGLPLRPGEEPAPGDPSVAGAAGSEPAAGPTPAGMAGPSPTVSGEQALRASEAGAPFDEEAAIEAPGLDAPPPSGGVVQDVPAPELFAHEGEVTLRRMVICKAVEDREPVEPTQVFLRTRDGQVWVYIEALNSADAERKLTVTFESADRAGAAAPPVDLSIGTGSPRWRTWARASTWRAPGRYAAVVRDAAGNVLGRGLFEVVEASR